MIVIGITGKKGSGKSTFAEICRNWLLEQGCNVVHYNFADELKDEVWNEFLSSYPEEGLSREDLDDPEKKKRFRLLMQWWGTEFKRANNDNYWIERLQAKIDKAKEDGVEVVLISDVRFPNEAQFVKNVYKGNILKVERNLPNDNDAHISEQSIDEIVPSVVFHNYNSLQDLKRIATRWLQEDVLPNIQVKPVDVGPKKCCRSLEREYDQMVEDKLSNQFHYKPEYLQYLEWLLESLVETVKDLDLLKKAIYYGKDLPFPLDPVDERRLDRYSTYSSESRALLLTDEKYQKLLHCFLGVMGEGAELLLGFEEAWLKNGNLDSVNMLEELGDQEFYLNKTRRLLGFERDEILRANIAKLNARYKEKFSSEEAIKRDLDNEFSALKSVDEN